MADDPTKKPGSITQVADDSDERISEVSNVNRAISNMQKQVDQQVSEMSSDVGDAEAIGSVQNSMIKVLQKLSYTVGDIGKGFGKISTNVAKSGKDAVSQYGRAIGQDINVNKQNIVAMALSKSTPIYGYFISKFMETDVWKSAAAKMKASIGNALSSVGQRLKGAVGSIRSSRKDKKDTDPLSKQARSIKVPHLARGGIVEKAGLAKLHAAEVVMPIDKLLSRIDDQVNLTRTMARTVQKGQLRSMAKMNTYVGSLEQHQKVGLVKGFFKALKDVHTQYEEPAEQRSLRALLAIQDALGAQIGSWTQVWQKMLIQNPVFRNAMITGNLIKKTLAAPFAPAYSFFKQRGGYMGHLSNSKQPFEAMSENVGVLYTGSMFRLDAISLYTKATAEAVRDLSSMFTGVRYDKLPGIKTGKWSFFGFARKMLNASTKLGMKGAGKWLDLGTGDTKAQDKLGGWAEKLTKERKIPWFGSHSRDIEDLYGPGKGKKEKKVSYKENRKAKKEAKNKDKEQSTSKKILKITDKNQRTAMKDFNLSKRALKAAKENLKENKEMNQREKRKSIFGFLKGGFGAIKTLLGSVMGLVLPLFMSAGFFGGGGGLGGTIGKLLKNVFLGKGGKGGLVRSIGSGFMKFLGKATTITALTGLGSVIGVAGAAAIGLAIGTGIDELLGISDKFAKLQDRWDNKAHELMSALDAQKVGQIKEMQSGSREGYKEYYNVRGMGAIAHNAQQRRSDLGGWGRRHITTINSAQETYMRDNIGEYMKFTPETITALRSEWLNERGGYLAKGMGADAEKYGKRREAAFLKFLKSKGKTMTKDEAAKQYKTYQEERGVGKFGQMMDKLPEIKDSMVGLYTRTYDVANQQVNEAVLTTQALKNKLETTSSDALRASKEAAGKVGDAFNQGMTVVSNTINNASTSNVTPAAQARQAMKDQFNQLLLRGDVDGD